MAEHSSGREVTFLAFHVALALHQSNHSVSVRCMATEQTPGEKYEAALETVREAGRVYDPVRDAYRAGQIGDDAYLAARRIYMAANVAFDVAYSEFEAYCAE